jgi:hypothetical protein
MAAVQSDQAVITEVIAAEQERNDATKASDRARLDRVIAEEFTNQHSDGHTLETKSRIIERCTSARHTNYTRGDLDVRVYGETAVMTGEIDIHFPPAADGSARGPKTELAIQVWVKRNGRWQLAAQQTTDKANPPA